MDSIRDDFMNQSHINVAAIASFVLLTIAMLISTICKIFYETDPIMNAFSFAKNFFSHESRRNINVDNWIDDYIKLQSKTDSSERVSAYQKLVNSYYELATIFYEWGWGTSFHFANRFAGETFVESIRKHEYYLAGRLGLNRGEKVLDVGCGVGGPYRNIAKFTNCDVTGITINEYQVNRGNELNRKAHLSCQVRSIQGDFMKLPFEENTFDGVYAIEATCHAPDRVGVYSQIYKVLKPGKIFACYEWCLTDRHDPKNPDHLQYKKLIEEGDGLPDLCHTSEVVRALKASGFEIIEVCDMADRTDLGGLPWFHPLTPSYNIFSQRCQFTPIGRYLTRLVLHIMEFFRLAPRGTCKVQATLQKAAIGISNGGLHGTFTPMFLAVVRKPQK